MSRSSRFAFTATRPVAVLMVFLSVMVFGAVSLRGLPVDLMPEIAYPTLTVRTEYPGAAPAEVENDVARPLEEVLGVVSGVTQISSVSRAEFADVVLEFGWDVDMDKASQSVIEKLDSTRAALPDEIKSPVLLRYDPTLDPVLVLMLRGPPELFSGVQGELSLRRIAEYELKRWLEPLAGVAAVKVQGGLEDEVQVDLQEDTLKSAGLSINDVIGRISGANVNIAGGSMLDGNTKYLVRTVNEFAALDELEELVITRKGGADIRLQDLGKVSRGYKERELLSRAGGEVAVVVEVYKEADANIVSMAKTVKQAVEDNFGPRLQELHKVSLSVSSDRSTFIESSIQEVQQTAIVGGVLAVLVLFLFLREATTTLIVSLSIPLSILMTFAPLSFAKVSLNMMSLGGLAMGIGMLVDNSIVVLESIHRCREEGDSPIQGTLRGVSEVGTAVIASTLTSVAVFFPMVFVQGIAGQLFGDLGLTVVFSLLASLLVALFFIPMLASRRLPQADETTPGLGARLAHRWQNWASVTQLRDSAKAARERAWRWVLAPYWLVRFVLHIVMELIAKLVASLVGIVAVGLVSLFRVVATVLSTLLKPVFIVFDRCLKVVARGYELLLQWALARRGSVLVIIAAVMAAVLLRLGNIETELVPQMHQGEVHLHLSFPVGTPLAKTNAWAAKLEKELLAELPHLQSLSTRVGSDQDDLQSANQGEHSARFAIVLNAPEGMSTQVAEEEAIEVATRIVSEVPGLDSEISRPTLFSFKKPIEAQVFAHDLDKLSLATKKTAALMRDLPGMRDVTASIRTGNPEVQIRYDRDAMARLGLDVRQVAERIRDKVLGREATKLSQGPRKVPIRVRLDRSLASSAEQLSGLTVNPGASRAIPLAAVAKVDYAHSPNQIRRLGQRRVGLISASLEGVALGTAAATLDQALAPLRQAEGVRIEVSGQQAEWDDSSRSLFLALGLSIFLVYVIMASQFESLVQPLVILISVPLGMAGVVVALDFLAIPLSIVVGLGAIMLVGIVVNNAIVLVDYIGQLRDRGLELTEAIAEAGKARFRPILMTTATTVLGLIPMAMGMGDGAEIRQPMAVTVIAGLSLSTLLTLIVIPVLYSVVESLRRRDASSAKQELLAELDGLEESS